MGYKKAKEKAKRIYSKIGRILCPALNNEYVSFNAAGFNHLMRKGRIPRTRNEQKRRFVLVSYVEKIIKNPRANILYQRKEIKEKLNRYGEKILITSTANFWTFIEKINDCVIKVVVRQKERGNKHFLSVMGDNIRINRKNANKRKIKKSPNK